MIDLSSKDYTYTSLKINEIKRLLKEIKPDINELTSSDVINISLLVFAYLCESDLIENEGKDLKIDIYDDLLLIDVEDLTMQLKFKNNLVNDIIDNKNNGDVLRKYETLRELILGDVL